MKNSSNSNLHAEHKTTMDSLRGKVDLHSIDAILDRFRQTDRGKNVLITRTIATGGMGGVYEVYDENLQRFAAMKVLAEELKDHSAAAQHFIEEARITGQLEHPNVIPLHSLGLMMDDRLFFTMKLIEGDALSDVIRQLKIGNVEYIKHYSQFTMLTIFRKVCDALSYAHSKNVIHRDLKPANIMVGDYGEVLLMDWGIAKYLGGTDDTIMSQRVTGDFTQTIDGVIKGSPSYMSPEQALARADDYDVRSDVFLLGATLYHMMTYSTPYNEPSITKLLDKAAKADFVAPKELAPERMLPDELNSIILKAMARNKDDRYQSVEDFSNAIDELMSGHAMSIQRTYQANEAIIRGNETGSEAFVILEGKVEVHKEVDGKRTVYTTLAPGDVFGEMACITDEVRSATVTALQETTCMVITATSVNNQLRKTPPWFEKIVNALVKRLRNTDAIAHPLLISDCTFEVANQIKLLFICYGNCGEGDILELDFSEVVCEVSQNLKIPQGRVEIYIAGLAHVDLVKISESSLLRIPNWTLFCEFVAYSRKLDGVSSDTGGIESSKAAGSHLFYSDGASVMHHFNRRDSGEPPRNTGRLLLVSDKLSATEAEEEKKSFAAKLSALHDYIKQES